MRLTSLSMFLGAIALCAIATASCSDKSKLRALCTSDDACIEAHEGNTSWACDRQIGDCVCTDDNACQAREHCEVRPGGDGRCHPNRTCDWNEDCEGRMFCDTVNHICRLTGCSADTMCPMGEICDKTTLTCIPGCRTHGDCATTGDVCLCMGDDGNPEPCTCDATTEAGRMDCEAGACTSDTCADDSFCKYGEICVDPEPGETLKRCVKDERGPFCEQCQWQPGASRCGEVGANFCINDTSSAAGGTYCGVDCNQGESCPNGFSCHDVLVLTDDECVSQEACQPPPGADDCTPETVEADCGPGAQCVDGKCAGTCRFGEDGLRGFCSCVTDDQCPKQTCDGGRCSITQARCSTDAECRTGPGGIYCVNDGELGYCFIGRNCAPEEGITCQDVRDGKGP